MSEAAMEGAQMTGEETNLESSSSSSSYYDLEGGNAAPNFKTARLPPKLDPFVKVYNTTVYWHGGSDGNVPCTDCLQNEEDITFLAPDYACNLERHPPPASAGDWSNGTKEFHVGVDPSRIVTQVNLTMHGRFRCPLNTGDSPPTILNILVENAAITQEPLDYTACLDCPICNLCDACMTNVTVIGTEFETWPTTWNYQINNTINVRVLSGVVCLYAIDIFVETVPAHLPTITTSITTSNATTTGGGGGNPKGFKMPVWGFILIGVSAFFCFASVVVWISYVTIGRMRKRDYGTIGDTDSEYSRPPSIYIDAAEVGDDTKRLLGLPINGEPGSAERQGMLKISHRQPRGSASKPRSHRATAKRSQEGQLVKQMDYGEIVLGERVGKGSYGEVFKGTWRGTEVAVKKLPYYFQQLEDKDQQRTFLDGFIQETQLMKTLRHPNVIQLYASFTQPEVMIVMEFMARGSLYQILHDKSLDLSWDLRRQILLDAARGMTYLHKSQPVIVHRDLKSHNLLVGEHWRCRVSDFGLSRMLTAMDTMTSCGTPSWTAPEVLRGEKYTEKCDVYSFGIVLWECVTRMTPHEGIPHFQVVFQVGTQGLRPDIPSDTPHHWARLTADCWAEDPDVRPSFEEILDRLQKF